MYNIGDLVELKIKYFLDDDGVEEGSNLYTHFNKDVGTIVEIHRFNFFTVYWQQACKYSKTWKQHLQPYDI